ncbi:MAG: hypothetical protein QM795_14020 [Pseudoxanthomonas sp.]
MDVRLAADCNWEAKLDHAMRTLALAPVFESKDYGSDLDSLCIVVMCRCEDLNFTQRIRYARKERALYVDVMLRLSDFVVASHAERRHMLAYALKHDVVEVLQKRRFRQFDVSAFASDFTAAIDRQLLAPEAARFDAFVLERATGF